jgi:hypothetical protein
VWVEAVSPLRCLQVASVEMTTLWGAEEEQTTAMALWLGDGMGREADFSTALLTEA